ncbi:MAG: TIGR02594 family protein, partial [Deltaproteobacteria bacterium]|nr:TIGR02594 family protein [Deltaproteobacteria bacterium]
RLGQVVVLWRGKPDNWMGHVGLYAGQDQHNVYLLGGNQDNMVCIKGYPRERVLGIRELRRIKHT